MQSKPLLLRRVLPEARRALWAERDLLLAQWLHRGARHRHLVAALAIVSRLGDGIFWLPLILGLAFFGDTHGRDVAVQMVLAAAVNFPLYLWLKRTIGRPRPFDSCPDIRACVRAIDCFSFPSGHTLHAVAFLTILSAYFPLAGAALLPFVLLVAVSRITLGLHYPSDVAAGAALGVAVASSVLLLY
jgi:undecaprenyl-diphosphatase